MVNASSVNNPNQPLTLSERLNGLSTGNSIANLHMNSNVTRTVEE